MLKVTTTRRLKCLVGRKKKTSHIIYLSTLEKKKSLKKPHTRAEAYAAHSILAHNSFPKDSF